MKKFILLILCSYSLIGCDIVIDDLDVKNGTKYIVTSKKKIKGDYHYKYRIVKAGGYGYSYTDTTDFDVGDTLIINIKKQVNNYGNN